jgi:hypothetical protein
MSSLSRSLPGPFADGNTRGGAAGNPESQYVEHIEGYGGEMFKAVCKLDLEGIVSKRLDAPYRWGRLGIGSKIKNPKASAETRVLDRTFRLRRTMQPENRAGDPVSNLAEPHAPLIVDPN